MIFSGEFEYRLDAQGRVSVPARFRDSFKGGLILTKGYEPCIVVYTPSEWESMAEKIAQMPSTQAKARKMMRLTFWRSFQAEMDRQGRVPLPAALRDYAGLKDEVVIAGTGSFLEIWSKDRWSEQSEVLDEEAWQIAENMEVRG